MRDIRLPEISDKFIDISDINENTSGIILAYKCNKPVVFIGYNNEDITWEYFDDSSFKCNENLLALLKAIMSNNYADSFKLIDFKQ